MTGLARSLVLVGCLTLISAACGSALANESAPAAAAAPKATPLSGKVVETMDGGGYTYIHSGER
jgi:hypothetical protein